MPDLNHPPAASPRVARDWIWISVVVAGVALPGGAYRWMLERERERVELHFSLQAQAVVSAVVAVGGTVR